MKEQVRREAKAQLARLVDRVLADGEVNEAEREALRTVLQDQLLQADEVREVFQSFLVDLRDEILADGTVSPQELKRCQALVDQLHIPLRLLPQEILDIVLGKKKPAAP